MIAIPAGDNLSIIQPYYDGGESYTNHHKYSLLTNYQTIPENKVTQEWAGICVKIAEKSETIFECTDMTEIDIEEFEKFVLYCKISTGVRVRIYCNGELVMDEVSGGMSGKIYGEKINIKVVKSLKYVFINSNDTPAAARLFYLGVVRDERMKKNPFTPEWEGFFSDEPNYSLYDNALITEQELEKFRNKIETDEYFAKMYEETKENCRNKIIDNPEDLIGRDVSRFGVSLTDMVLIGQIENDKELLKKACRYALSIASCEYWTNDAVCEKTPMTTWSGRAFTESDTVCDVAMVISLAGGLLTWHGRHYLYDKIIMKGLPRIEADLLTVDYIYHMNQGIVFLSGYTAGLAVLVKEYPRYSIRLQEAEDKLDEMLSNSFEKDGSSTEGATYWLFTVMKYLTAAYSIAKYKNMSIKEFVGDKLNVISSYGISVLDENTELIPFNDSHWHQSVGPFVSAMLYDITGDERWAKVYYLAKGGKPGMHLLMMSQIDVPRMDMNIVNTFYHAKVSGYTQVYRDGIHFIATGGPSNSTHAHEDKGSFIIYKNGEMIAPDCCDSYDVANAADLYMSRFHSLAVPENNGTPINQIRGDGYSAPIETAEYKEGVFSWRCDCSNIWDTDKVIKNIRTIKSDKADEFVICDYFEFTEPICVDFRLNVWEKNSIEVSPVNWKPVAENYELVYENAEQKAYQIVLKSEAEKRLELITKIIIK